MPHATTARRRAIRYLRVSTDDQARGYSLADQGDLLQRWCASRDVEVVATFSDDESAKTRTNAKGVATLGESFDARPGWQELEAWLRAHPGGADLVVFKDYSRFSRDATDALVTIRRLEAMGVEVQAAEQPIDWAVPEQVPLVMLYIGMPEAENRRRSLNIRRGVQRAHREGRWVHTPPTGYTKRYDERGKPYIVPDEALAPLVREAFALAAAGHTSLDAIRKKLKRPSGRPFIQSRYRFGQLLRNRAYLGQVRVKADKREGRPEEWVEGLHEPLVDADTFARVQRRLDGNERGRERKSVFVDELPLRGHILCPRTGARLTGSGSRSRHGYRVWYYHGRGKGATRIKADDAHEAFVGLLRSVQVAPEVSTLFGRMVDEALAEEGARWRREAGRIKKERREVEGKLLRADEAYVEGRIEADSYARLKSRYAAERDAFDAALARCRAVDGDRAARVRWALELLGRLDEAWALSGVEGRSALVGSIWPSGVVVEDDACRTPGESPVLAALSGRTRGERTKRTGHPAVERQGVPSGGDAGSRTRVREALQSRRLHA